MLKKILNVLLVLSIGLFGYYLYQSIFHLPTDGVELAELQLRSAYSALFMGVVVFFHARVRK